MEKSEIKGQLEEIERLIDRGRKEQALDILDGINWKKIRNVNTLLLASDIYEKADAPEDARELLETAHDRSPIGRMIIYRLALLSLKLGDISEAEEYYDEFVEIAPHDSLKYVIKYKIQCAKNVDAYTLISTLEELKSHDFMEEWAFELACLYRQTSQVDKCINMCDEIVLWFGEGPYVEKALELKMIYHPLDKDQEDKYRAFQHSKDNLTEIRPEDSGKDEILSHTITIPRVELSTDRFNTVNLQAEIKKNIEEIMQATEAGEITENMEMIKGLVEEIPYLTATGTGTSPIVVTPEEDKKEQDAFDDTLRDVFNEYLAVEHDGQYSMKLPEYSEMEEQVAGQMTISEVMEEWEKTRRAAEAALMDAEKRKMELAKAKALEEANQIMDRLVDVGPRLEAGVAPETLLKEQYLGETIADVNDILQEQIERMQEETEEASDADESDKEEVSKPKEDHVPIEELEDPEIGLWPLYEAKKEVERQETGPIVSPEAVQASEEDDTDEDDAIEKATAAIGKESENKEEKPLSMTQNLEASLAAAIKAVGFDEFENTSVEEETEDESKAEASDDTVTEPETEAETEAGSLDTAETGKAKESAINETGPIESEPKEAADNSAVSRVIKVSPKRKVAEDKQEERVYSEPVLEKSDPADYASVEVQSDTIPLPKIEYDPVEFARTKEFKGLESLSQDQMSPDGEAGVFLDKSPKRVLNAPKNPAKLTDVQRQILSYFAPVRGMEESLYLAISGAEERIRKQDRSSYGNIMIIGKGGSGRTTLAADLIEIIRMDTGGLSGITGRITASNLNQKDIRALYEKISGGCLIIEEAGDLNRDTAVNLSLLMENDKSGTLVILEDKDTGYRRLRAISQKLIEMFTERIEIPDMSIDELVNFGKVYIRDQGYSMDDMAVLALYDKINIIQHQGSMPINITTVRNILEDALSHAKDRNSGLFGLLSPRSKDDSGNRILIEKDFV
ncbi:MAG: hypothetical protein K6F00_06955 [Lachnospiraceae bacterium]|nr:hypothetical protein [Lachnospiraceae bacterium]